MPQLCDVCAESKDTVEDPLLHCQGCALRVHSLCYGFLDKPPSMWLCNSCDKSSKPPACVFCLKKGGALKRCENSSSWAHILCASWLPPAGFGCLSELEPITGISEALDAHSSHTCSLCSVREGACRKCPAESCRAAFHPLCARDAKLHFDVNSGIYCRAHAPQAPAPAKPTKRPAPTAAPAAARLQDADARRPWKTTARKSARVSGEARSTDGSLSGDDGTDESDGSGDDGSDRDDEGDEDDGGDDGSDDDDEAEAEESGGDDDGGVGGPSHQSRKRKASSSTRTASSQQKGGNGRRSSDEGPGPKRARGRPRKEPVRSSTAAPAPAPSSMRASSSSSSAAAVAAAAAAASSSEHARMASVFNPNPSRASRSQVAGGGKAPATTANAKAPAAAGGGKAPAAAGGGKAPAAPLPSGKAPVTSISQRAPAVAVGGKAPATTGSSSKAAMDRGAPAPAAPPSHARKATDLRVALLEALCDLHRRDTRRLLSRRIGPPLPSVGAPVLPPCTPPTLFLLIQRLHGGGYASVAELLADFDALAATVRTCAQRLPSEGSTTDGHGARAADGSRQERGDDEDEAARLLAACRARITVVLREVSRPTLSQGPLRQATAFDSLVCSEAGQEGSEGGEEDGGSGALLSTCFVGRDGEATKPTGGRAWWQATKAGTVILPHDERRALPSALERDAHQASASRHRSSIGASAAETAPTAGNPAAMAPSTRSAAADAPGAVKSGVAAARDSSLATATVGAAASATALADARAQLEWCAQHFPAFRPLEVPCECTIDARHHCMLLGWAPPSKLLPSAQPLADSAPGGEEARGRAHASGRALGADGEMQSAIVSGYFCQRPVRLHAGRCELSIEIDCPRAPPNGASEQCRDGGAESTCVEAGGHGGDGEGDGSNGGDGGNGKDNESGGNNGDRGGAAGGESSHAPTAAAARGRSRGWVSVRWADGRVTDERAARFLSYLGDPLTAALAQAPMGDTADATQASHASAPAEGGDGAPSDASQGARASTLAGIEARVRKAAPIGWWERLEALQHAGGVRPVGSTNDGSGESEGGMSSPMAAWSDGGGARARFLCDVDVWGFGWMRRGVLPPWSEAESQMLARHADDASSELRPLILQLLTDVVGRSFAYLRQRAHEHYARRAHNATLLTLRPAAAPTTTDKDDGGTAAAPTALAPKVATTLSVAVAADAPVAATGASTSETVDALGRVHAAVVTSVWQLAAKLGRRMPPELWELTHLETEYPTDGAIWGGRIPRAVRAHFKCLEVTMFRLEEELQRTMEAEERGEADARHARLARREAQRSGPRAAADGTTDSDVVGSLTTACLAAPNGEPLQAVPTSQTAASGWQQPEVDGRRYVFRIDDITYERVDAMPSAHQYRHPISAVNEVDEEPFPGIDYLHACVAGEGVCLETPPEFLAGCACCVAACDADAEGDAVGSGGARAAADECPATDAMEVERHASQRSRGTGTASSSRGERGGHWSAPLCCTSAGGCSCILDQLEQSGRVAYDENARLCVKPGTPVYECNAACSCPGDCGNRVVQRGICTSLQVFKTRYKGWALRALQRIPSGTFVCEYTGEVIPTDEAERRGVEYDKGGFSTLFDLDSAGDAACEYTIDATYRSGVASFLNHSCAPNLAQTSVWVDTASLALPRIAFFALRDIEPFEELTFDYKYEEGGRTLECHCGASNCRRWLY